MNVDQIRAAVEEADRKGEQLLPGYKPSDVFEAERLAEGKDHADQGHDCGQARTWRMVTENIFHAVLLKHTFEMDRVDAQHDWMEETGLPRSSIAPLGFHLATGLLQPEAEEEMTDFMTAFTKWSVWRLNRCIHDAPEDTEDDDVLLSAMFESFTAGAVFAQKMAQLEADRAGRE